MNGVWNVSVVSSYDTIYYSNGTDRVEMTNNRYAAKYFFRSYADVNEVFYVHGGQFVDLASAINENIPTVPETVTMISLYVGKIVYQKGATVGTAYPRIWDSELKTAQATVHNTLSNIQGGSSNEYYHVTQSKYKELINADL